MLMETGNTKNSALMAKKAPTMPKPQWHPPWKLYRVSMSAFPCASGAWSLPISQELGWDLGSPKENGLLTVLSC